MHESIHTCTELTANDIEFLQRIEGCMSITADVSRADFLLCTLNAPDQCLIVSHAMPHSISSLYRQNAEGRIFSEEEHALAFRALRLGRAGQRQRNVLPNGAPIIQQTHPIRNATGRVIAALLIETNMIAHERQKRRNRYFRQALRWLQAMCLTGSLNQIAALTPFSLYDGIYLVNAKRSVVYMSGIASNLFRAVGLPTRIGQQWLSTLEEVDQQLVEQVFASDICQQKETESPDGRTWIRKAIPLRSPMRYRWVRQLGITWLELNRHKEEHGVDAVLVLLHNATDAVAKQRELQVKSTIIQEVHHRIKNNLQNVVGILRMQARRSPNEEVRQHLTDAINRVLSMSVIHEFLSQDEHRPINVRDVCQRIASQVIEVSRSPQQAIEVRIQGPTIQLPARQATPFAMVLNELVMNAIEHGIGQRNHGVITLSLQDFGDSLELRVEDDGAGLPADFGVAKRDSLGLQIVQTLVQSDLKGTLRFENIASAEGSTVGGVRASLTIPKLPLGK